MATDAEILAAARALEAAQAAVAAAHGAESVAEREWTRARGDTERALARCKEAEIELRRLLTIVQPDQYIVLTDAAGADCVLTPHEGE